MDTKDLIVIGAMFAELPVLKWVPGALTRRGLGQGDHHVLFLGG